jgi:membrane-associated protease RseP (regulator of RpoE activity)
MTPLLALFVGTVLVLAGIGLGTVGATVIGMSRLAEWQRQTGPGGQPGQQAYGSPSASARTGATPSSAPTTPSPSTAPAGATLGVEAMDAGKPGALVVGVHVPGPGYTAGLVRGDLLLALDETRIDTAADLARAVADTRPGTRAILTVRHRSGGYQQLTVVPGVVT